MHSRSQPERHSSSRSPRATTTPAATTPPREPENLPAPPGPRRPPATRRSPPVLSADSKFMAAAKAAGLNQTLAGPAPYTVLIPRRHGDRGRPPAHSTPARQPRAADRGHHQPGPPRTVLAADIGKAINAGEGRASSRRWAADADRDQGRRQDGPDRFRRAQSDRHQGRRAVYQRRRPPRRCRADAGQAAAANAPAVGKKAGSKPARSRIIPLPRRNGSL